MFLVSEAKQSKTREPHGVADVSVKNRKRKRQNIFHSQKAQKCYFNLKRNLPLLFTYVKFDTVPNTNNALESFFTDLKTATRIHKGLNLITRAKFVSWCFTIKNNQN